MHGIAPFVALAVVVGCYSPAPKPGAPCPDGTCPSGLSCSAATMTCEPRDIDASFPIDSELADACTPSGGDEVCGDGIDQDCMDGDAMCPANDLAAGALDVTAGGTFTADVRYAHNDASVSMCGIDGGRDVFYQITLTAPEVYYFDTLASDYNTVIRVYSNVACSAVTAAVAATSCTDDSCGGQTSMTAARLPTGTSCIVVDQQAGTETKGALTLAVVRSGRDAVELGTSHLINYAQTAANQVAPCGGDGLDFTFYIAACPGSTLTANTCDTHTVWDTVLYLHAQGNPTALTCNDDDATCAVTTKSRISSPLTAGGLYWLTVDSKVNPLTTEHLHVYSTITP